MFTTNKIYFSVSNIDDFVTKYNNYFENLEISYKCSSFKYENKDYYNIALDFVTGKLTKNVFYKILEDFCLINTKNSIKKAFYQYKNGLNEVKYVWINKNISMEK